MDKEKQYTLFPYGKVILLISLVLILEWYLYLSAIKFKAILPGFTTMLKSELNMILVIVITLIALIFFRKYKDNFLSLTYTALLIILTTFFARFLPLTQHKMVDYSLSKFDRFFGINSAKIFQYMFFHHNTMTHIIGYGYSALVTLAAIGIILLAIFRPVNLKRLVSAYGISFILLIPFYYFSLHTGQLYSLKMPT